MRAAIFSPYLDTLGGGERYLSGVARVLVSLGYKVDIKWSDKKIIPKLEARFGLDLSGVDVVKSIKRGWAYDFCFWLSDGSVPFLFSRKNFIHFQVPFKNVGGSSLLNKIKFLKVEKVVVNSSFTKRFIDREYGVNSVVVYPSVDIDAFKSDLREKEKIILAVGRFSQLKQAKNQDILIKAFSKVCQSDLSRWRLILAGGSEVGGKNYVKKLRLLSSNLPVEIVENPDFEKIRSLYAKASIFWSASGFGVSEIENPERVEHFGISVVEAMASGAVPIAFEAGGHKEIISHGNDGFLWKKEDDLIKLTKKVANNENLWLYLSRASIEKSKQFSYRVFSDRIKKLLEFS